MRKVYSNYLRFCGMQNKQIRLLSRNTHSLINYPQGKIQLQLKELELHVLVIRFKGKNKNILFHSRSSYVRFT